MVEFKEDIEVLEIHEAVAGLVMLGVGFEIFLHGRGVIRYC
jgi:hypothetical protein